MENEKKLQTFVLTVTGMTCAGCSSRVEKALNQFNGVVKASVNLATCSATVMVEPEVTKEDLENVVRRAGYGVTDEPLELVETRRYHVARRRALLAICAMLPPVVVMILAHVGSSHFWHRWMDWVNLVCGAVALFVAGFGTLKGAWIAISHRHGNMDCLISLGAFGSWFTALLRVLGFSAPAFGMMGSMMMAFHLVGRYLESRLRDRAGREIRALLALKPQQAKLLQDGQWVIVPPELLSVGAVVLVEAGEKISADGKILNGEGTVDESLLTGEPFGVSKKSGDLVTGGSILVTGRLEILVSAVGEESFLSQISAMIQEAQGTKVPLQAIADKITGYFVPTIVSLAVIVGLCWFAWGHEWRPYLEIVHQYLPWVHPHWRNIDLAVNAFLSTLLIACPCALGLATPMALVASTAAAGRMGMLIRDGEAIQTLGTVTAAVFDKTGTLTLGRPQMVFCNVSPQDRGLVASMERHSSHPLAVALQSLSDQQVQVEQLEEISGQGMRGVWEGSTVEIGAPLDDDPVVNQQKQLGRTVVQLRVDGHSRGVMAFEDQLRPGAVEMVRQLKTKGILTVMATGDHHLAAEKIGDLCQPDQLYASLRPEDKLNLVRDLQRQGHRVLMMGDGINDAAALKASDVAIAISEGSELAVENADLIALRDGGVTLAQAISLSQKTSSVIRQNLLWAFGYNFFAVPLAMAGLAHPLMAEIAMTLSSVTLILNSLRLKK